MDWNKLQKMLDRRPTLLDHHGEYAVLVPLVETAQGLCLLYEVRAAQLRHHAAEVCFPGGRMEVGETAVQCALRETREELGIEERHITVLGQLDFLYLRFDGLMHPVLARLAGEALSSLTLNPEEVQETFLVPLAWLQAHPPRTYSYQLKPMVDDDFPYEAVHAQPSYRWSTGRMDVPVYEGLPHPLWGLTGRITKHVAELLK